MQRDVRQEQERRGGFMKRIVVVILVLIAFGSVVANSQQQKDKDVFELRSSSGIAVQSMCGEKVQMICEFCGRPFVADRCAPRGAHTLVQFPLADGNLYQTCGVEFGEALRKITNGKVVAPPLK